MKIETVGAVVDIIKFNWSHSASTTQPSECVQVLFSNIICPERGGEHIVFILVEPTLETFMFQPATLTTLNTKYRGIWENSNK